MYVDEKMLTVPNPLAPVWSERVNLQTVHTELQAASLEDFARRITPDQIDDTTGLRYVDLDPSSAKSNEAIVVPFPFATGWRPHMAARMAVYLAAQTGVTGEPGRIIALPNSTTDAAARHLSPAELNDVRRGNFTPLRTREFDLLRRLGIEKIHVLGYSQGAAMGANIAAEASRYGMSLGNVGIFEPPNVRRQRFAHLLASFATAGRDSAPRAMDACQVPLLRQSVAGISLKASLQNYTLADNWAIAQGMACHELGTDLEQVLATQPQASLTLMRGGVSNITPQKPFAALVQKLQAKSRNVHAITVEGADHGVGDNLIVQGVLAHVALMGVGLDAAVYSR